MTTRTEAEEILSKYLFLCDLSKIKHIDSGILDVAYKSGLLKKSDFVHGKYYYGKCRNAKVARWDAKLDKFQYMRYKFGTYFADRIEAPEDDTGFDIFQAVCEIEPDENEVVLFVE